MCVLIHKLLGGTCSSASKFLLHLTPIGSYSQKPLLKKTIEAVSPHCIYIVSYPFIHLFSLYSFLIKLLPPSAPAKPFKS